MAYNSIEKHLVPDLTNVVLNYLPESLIDKWLIEAAIGMMDYDNDTFKKIDCYDYTCYYHYFFCEEINEEIPKYIKKICPDLENCNDKTCNIYDNFWNIAKTKNIADDKVKKIILKYIRVEMYDIINTQTIKVKQENKKYFTAYDVAKAANNICKNWIKHCENVLGLDYGCYFNQQSCITVKINKIESFDKDTLVILLDINMCYDFKKGKIGSKYSRTNDNGEGIDEDNDNEDDE
jgi:hypothetical protein